MRLGMIWAQDPCGVLGASGTMLWRVPADFRHFKAATLGGAVIMGRTTWESIGGALTGRANIVLTRRDGWEATADGAVRAASLRHGLALGARALAGGSVDDPREGAYRALPRLWVIGGGSVYGQALAEGLPDVLVVSVLDLDATERARGRGLPASALVRAPGISTQEWAIDPALSDPEDQWRPVSGDARWRVEIWRHL